MSEWKSPFDDDNHTLHDGPLQRFFRMRKWFFAVGFVLLLLNTGWWNFEATTSAVGLGGFPKAVLHSALTFTGGYLLVQALLVTFQIVATYRDTSVARAKLINIIQATDLLKQAEASEQSLRDQGVDVRALREEIFARDRIETFGRHLPSGKRRASYSEARSPRLVDEKEQTMVEAMRARVMAARLQSPEAIRLITATETILDTIRILPTLLFLLYALIIHGNVVAFQNWLMQLI